MILELKVYITNLLMEKRVKGIRSASEYIVDYKVLFHNNSSNTLIYDSIFEDT